MKNITHLEDKCFFSLIIHTIATGSLPQDVEKKKTEPRTPHFFEFKTRYGGELRIANVGIKACNIQSGGKRKKLFASPVPL